MEILTNTDISLIRDIIGLDGATDISDSLVEHHIDVAEQIVKEKSGFRSPATLVQEYYDGNGDNVLLLNKYPVSAINGLSVNGSPITDYVFYPSTGQISLSGVRAFTLGNRNVYVNYYTGSSTIPVYLKELVRYEAAKMCLMTVGSKESRGADSETAADHSVSYGEKPYNGIINMLNTELQRLWQLVGKRPVAEVSEPGHLYIEMD